MFLKPHKEVIKTITLNLRLILHPEDYGYSISIPALPGCLSQGDTEEEAIANIEEALQGIIEVGNTRPCSCCDE